MKSKQVIVMRTDLNMRKGKMIAQGAHASMKVLLDIMRTENIDSDHLGQEKILYIEDKSALNDWINGRFTKVCCQVNSEKELLELFEKAKSLGIPAALITDAGLTEFGGVPTNTCIAIGPDWEDKVNEITGHLKLL